MAGLRLCGDTRVTRGNLPTKSYLPEFMLIFPGVPITDMPTVLSKLISPGDGRKSRLRDAQDNLVPLSRLIRNGPRSAATAILVRFTGHRPTQPWISYDAIDVLARILTKKSRVLEYGSGVSTVWYAHHAAEVVAVEDDAAWADFNRQAFAGRGVSNVRLVTASDREEYVFAKGLARPQGDKFDLVIIDGRYRDGCAENALRVVRPGGWVYLDNSDVTQFNDLDGNVAKARSTIVDAARAMGRTEQYFVDFSPACLHPTGGTLVQL